MAKRAKTEGNDGRPPNSMSFAQAMESLNNGEPGQRPAYFLGIGPWTQKTSPQAAANSNAGVVCTSQHALFASRGVTDIYVRVVQQRGLVEGFVLDPSIRAA